MESWIGVPGSEGALKRMDCPPLEIVGQTITAEGFGVEVAVGVENTLWATSGVKVAVGGKTTLWTGTGVKVAVGIGAMGAGAFGAGAGAGGGGLGALMLEATAWIDIPNKMPTTSKSGSLISFPSSIDKAHGAP